MESTCAASCCFHKIHYNQIACSKPILTCLFQLCGNLVAVALLTVKYAPVLYLKWLLFHFRQMWTYLAHIAELLRNFKVVLQEVQPKQRELFKQGLGTSARQRTYAFSRFVTQETPTVIIGYFPHVTGHDGKILPGFLEYFTQGIVYLLYVYYTLFFDPSTAGDKQAYELNVTEEISKALYVSICF